MKTKDRSWFKFNAAKWLMGEISHICANDLRKRLECAGAFTFCLAEYIASDGDIEIARLKSRYGEAIDWLLEYGILKENQGKAVISFLDEQSDDMAKTNENNSANGKKGAEARWRKHGASMAQDGRQTDRQTDRQNNITQPAAAVVNLFVLFWAVYPKKKSKGDAEKVWKSLKPDTKLTNRMIDKINQLKTTPDWTKDGGQFIPYPATWLRAQGWEDEVVGSKPAVKLDAEGRPPKPNEHATWNEDKRKWEVKSENFFG